MLTFDGQKTSPEKILSSLSSKGVVLVQVKEMDWSLCQLKLFPSFFLEMIFRLPSCRFVEYPLQHTAILNLFTMHGWSLATAFQSNGFPPGSSTGAPSDTLIFTHPNW